MKPYEKRVLRDDAVYWAASTPDGTGDYTYASPVQIKCRWEKKQELFLAGDGQEHRSRAVVYTDRDLALEGFLFLGTLDDISSAATPDVESDAFRIRGYETINNMRGDKTIRKVWL